MHIGGHGDAKVLAAGAKKVYDKIAEIRAATSPRQVVHRYEMHGVPVAKEMGINTWASFGGTDDAAVVDGDFAMLENELQPVLRTMRKEGINIVAIHQHMSQEQPRYLFLPYWGKGKSGD